MECRHGNFWIGLGIGSILGAVAYRLSRTAKAKQLENDIYDAIHRIIEGVIRFFAGYAGWDHGQLAKEI